MYNFCEARDLGDAWVYLYQRWYREPWFKRWARSTRVTIPIGKTAMMIESQWRILKRDVLINNPRPRLDLLVWIIIHEQSRLVLHNFLSKIVNRAQTLDWELEFVREWDTKSGRNDPGLTYMDNRPENPNAEQLCRPSLDDWTCGWPSFARSRFMLCKHLISRYRERKPSMRCVFGAHDYFISRQSIAPYIQIRPVCFTCKIKKNFK